MVEKIPAGTRIYLTKFDKQVLYIKPDCNIIGDNMYVAYDVRINGQTIIPKGTRVVGDWITETTPCYAAQFQVLEIYISAKAQPFDADSEVFEKVVAYNSNEVNSSAFFYKKPDYKSQANVNRRVAQINSKSKILSNNKLDTLYIEINTKEIPATIMQDFIAVPCVVCV